MTEMVLIPKGELMMRELSREDIDVLKSTICAKLSDAELRLFIKTANKLGLDPFSKQIHAVKRWTKNGDVLSIQVGIDGFRLQAQRTKQYQGQVGPQWCGVDGVWKDLWLDSGKPPFAARVGVWREGFREPIWASARWEAYKQTSRAGLAPMWERMGDLMLAKCAEALALRRAFPAELSGVYTPEEMGQAGNEPIDVAPEMLTPHLPLPGALPSQPAPEADTSDGHDEGFDEETGEVWEHAKDPETKLFEPARKAEAPTKGQLAKAHILKKDLHLTDELWRARLKHRYGVDSSALLSRRQIAEIIDAMEETMAKRMRKLQDMGRDMAGLIKEDMAAVAAAGNPEEPGANG